MPRDYRLYLDDILESIDAIIQYVDQMNFDEFSTDRKTVDAVVRNMEVIGEAARNLPDEIKELAPEIEWKKIVALRNVLAHEYFNITKKILWDIIHTKLPPLKIACLTLMRSQG
ncbi:MAG: DUF86 domain-containing protein [Candidatus Abyssobacteria bacterium SURF_17]|uniref:DUF86 domain-containing protein n=1 Tax=Candidatus Abyssobacteria bacterium SURF_17 TaxID=2093361 RepID=A0A419ENM8_9BACT|nr:MAG: DUF86 domain-containing protein [Candidatus Abyssubacteria bacterium SURF_17]